MAFTESHRLSFEFFPPKTEKGFEKLKTVRHELARLAPEFFSVTYGAGGSTRENTYAVVKEGLSEGYAVAPHLSFGGDGKKEVASIVQEYIELGVKRIVALRGDLPSGFGDAARLVHASELVEFIREQFSGQLHIEVAAYPEVHPEAPSYDEDIGYLKHKFDMGADSAITQYFFNLDAYERFVDACVKKGIHQPIYPGIMPITNLDNLERFSRNCGAEIPRWLSHRVRSFSNPQDMLEFTTDFIADFCERLLALGAPGLHFYTMNQSEPSLSICRKLGLVEKAS